MKFSITSSYNTSRIELIALIPQTVPGRQDVLSIVHSINPSKVFNSDGNKYAEYVFVDPERSIDINIKAEIEIFKYDLNTAMNNRYPAYEQHLGKYLIREKYIEKDDPMIQKVARQITGKNEIGRVEKIYDFVLDNIEYSGYNTGEIGAARTLNDKKGDCNDYSDLFIALCRAKKIPARVAEGHTVEFDETPGHAWAEVYFRRHGWVPFDPLWGDLGAVSFENSINSYIYLSNTRNDDILSNGHYFTYRWWGEPIQCDDTVSLTY
ncbi:MAG: transglutaminase domain-containing protein [Thermodesulfobacteriota bacterium]|nr:transglutaminase domain-containing protein [Thermodesulfobacteriota bacterium]